MLTGFIAGFKRGLTTQYDTFDQREEEILKRFHEKQALLDLNDRFIPPHFATHKMQSNKWSNKYILDQKYLDTVAIREARKRHLTPAERLEISEAFFIFKQLNPQPKDDYFPGYYCND